MANFLCQWQCIPSAIRSIVLILLVQLLVVEVIFLATRLGNPLKYSSLSSFATVKGPKYLRQAPAQEQFVPPVRSPSKPEPQIVQDAELAEAIAKNQLTNAKGGKKVAGISLIVPCNGEDWQAFTPFLKSLNAQTVWPYETILVLSLTNVSTASLHSMEDVQKSRLNSFSPPLEDDPLFIRTKEFDEMYMPNTQHEPWTLFTNIPRLQLIVRSGKQYAGSNRLFGVRQTAPETDLVSFFDCDDYMHRQRTEILWKVFKQNPDLDILLHGLERVPVDQPINPFPKSLQYWNQSDFTHPSVNLTFEHSYDQVRKALPKLGLRQWNISDYRTEVNWPGQPIWGFALRMHRKINVVGCCHNAWSTIRKKIFDQIPYPVQLRRGQDGLFNWRLLHSGKHLNYIRIKMGMYRDPNRHKLA